MLAILMTRTNTSLIIHGRPYDRQKLLQWTEGYGSTSWLEKPSPHMCHVLGCALVRAHTRRLWARVAASISRSHAAQLALSRTLPSELARACAYATGTQHEFDSHIGGKRRPNMRREDACAGG